MSSKLKEAREAAGYTIDEVANAINVRKQYIVNLEEENFDGLPGDVYVKGYTKIYCDFLGIKDEQQGAFQEEQITEIIVDNEKSGNRKYVILFSAIMLIIVVIIYTILKPANIDVTDSEIIQNTQEQHENNKEKLN